MLLDELWIESGVGVGAGAVAGQEARGVRMGLLVARRRGRKEFKDTWTDVLQGEESLAVEVFFRQLRELGMLGFEGYHGCFVRQG
jgi:hypothetical protein